MSNSDKSQVATQTPEWIHDPRRQSEFLERLQSKIEQQSKWWAGYCRVPQEWQDIAQDLRLELCSRLLRYRETREESSVFSQPTAKQAADVAIKTYLINNLARNLARGIMYLTPFRSAGTRARVIERVEYPWDVSG